VDSLLCQYPWLVEVTPLFGIALGWARRQGWLRGFGLLGTALATALVVVGTFGLAAGWGPHQWRAVPMTVVLLVGLSNVSGSTFGTILETVGIKKAAP
jgi:hypothetical protein